MVGEGWGERRWADEADVRELGRAANAYLAGSRRVRGNMHEQETFLLFAGWLAGVVGGGGGVEEAARAFGEGSAERDWSKFHSIAEYYRKTE